MTDAPESPKVEGKEPVFRHLDDPDVTWQAVKRQRNADGTESCVWEKWLSFSSDPQYLSLYAKYDPGMIVRRHGHFSPHVLFVIEGIVREYEKRGGSEADAIADLENLERTFKLAPRSDAERAKNFLARLAEGPSRGGMAAAVDVKLLKPVFAGQRIDYHVTSTHVLESLARCEVSAEVSGELVAKGTISSALGVAIPRIA